MRRSSEGAAAPAPLGNWRCVYYAVPIAICLYFNWLGLKTWFTGDDFAWLSLRLQVHSFHDLRWPVWGVCWLLQSIFGPGLLSYYGVPILYLMAGAAVSFVELSAPFGHDSFLLDVPPLDRVVKGFIG